MLAVTMIAKTATKTKAVNSVFMSSCSSSVASSSWKLNEFAGHLFPRRLDAVFDADIGGVAGLMDYFNRELVNTMLHLGVDKVPALGRSHVRAVANGLERNPT